MLNSIYNTGVNGLVNSQSAMNVTSNNISNADVVGYKKQTPIYETSESMQSGGLYYGTGADVTAIETSTNYFIEQQYLSNVSDTAMYTSMLTYQLQLESILGQSDTTGLTAAFNLFYSAWNTYSSDPTQAGAWEEVLSASEKLSQTLTGTYAQMEATQASIEQEISAQVVEANVLLDEIAMLNAEIAANPTNSRNRSSEGA